MEMMVSREDGSCDPADERARAIAGVMSHPQAARIFCKIAEQWFGTQRVRSDGDPEGITVREIAESLGESPRRVRYHIANLVDLGFAEVVEVQKRRGVVERYYAATELPQVTRRDVEGDAISLVQQQKLTIKILKSLFADATAALSAGTYNRRPEWTAARYVGQVDEEGWEELSAIQEAAMAEAQAVLLDADARLRDTGDQPVPVRAGFLLFEAAS